MGLVTCESIGKALQSWIKAASKQDKERFADRLQDILEINSGDNFIKWLENADEDQLNRLADSLNEILNLDNYLLKSDELRVLEKIGMHPDKEPPYIRGREQLDHTVKQGVYQFNKDDFDEDQIPFQGGDGSIVVLGTPTDKKGSHHGDVKQLGWSLPGELYYRGADSVNGEGNPNWREWRHVADDINLQSMLKELNVLTNSSIAENDEGLLKLASPLGRIQGTNIALERWDDWSDLYPEYKPIIKARHLRKGVFETITPTPLRSNGQWQIDVPKNNDIKPIVVHDIEEEKLQDGSYKTTIKTYESKLIVAQNESGEMELSLKRGNLTDPKMDEGFILLHYDDLPEPTWLEQYKPDELPVGE